MTEAPQWNGLAARWARLKPPLRPAGQVVDFLRATVPEGAAPVLLLGATPELARAFEPLQAVDRSIAMIGAVWPGSTARRLVSLADWLEHPPLDHRFRAVIGDGSLNALASASQVRALLARLDGWLAPGGTFACRVYSRPAARIGTEALAAVLAGHRKINFHAFKWLMAMHLAAGSGRDSGGRVAVAAIRDLFLSLCDDRAATAVRCGWDPDDVETIDAYRDSPDAYLFPTTDEFDRMLPAGLQGEWHAVGGYDLAEHCPVWVVRQQQKGMAPRAG